MANTNRVVDGLDLEWLSLIIEARDLGISKETVRNFLNQREAIELVTENS
ncbi:MAG TPA: anti-repressor SinI family protein [Neobacillus sp.]